MSGCENMHLKLKDYIMLWRTRANLEEFEFYGHLLRQFGADIASR